MWWRPRIYNQEYFIQQSYHLESKNVKQKEAKTTIKSFSDKNKLKEFINTKPVLQEMLEGLL